MPTLQCVEQFVLRSTNCIAGDLTLILFKGNKHTVITQCFFKCNALWADKHSCFCTLAELVCVAHKHTQNHVFPTRSISDILRRAQTELVHCIHTHTHIFAAAASLAVTWQLWWRSISVERLCLAPTFFPKLQLYLTHSHTSNFKHKPKT